MKRTTSSALWVFSVCGALAAGALVSRRTPSDSAPARAAHDANREAKETADNSDLFVQLRECREAVREKEIEIDVLREKLDALRSQLPPPLSPELGRELKERLEARQRAEAENPQTKRRNALQRKILQRRDKALREEGLTELLALLQSTDLEDQRTAFATLDSLHSITFDKETFRPYVLAGLSDADASVRKAAVDCIYAVCPNEEALEMAMRMVKDPDVGIRSWAALELNGSSVPDHTEMAIAALRSLLQESDVPIKQHILSRLNYCLPQGMDDVVVKLLGEKGVEYEAGYLLHYGTYPISGTIVERLAEMYREGTPDETIMRLLGPDWIHLGAPDDSDRRGQRCLAQEAKPIVREIYLRVVRESLSNGRRSQALEGLQRLGDPWVIPVLDEITRSPDAEGIEDELAKTIEHLRNRPTQAR
jgi:hypothetical protein